MTEAGQSRAKDDTYKSYNLYLMITYVVSYVRSEIISF